MNTISTYNLRELHCDIFISDVFPYIDERTAAAVLLLLLMIIIVGYTRSIRKLRAQTKQGFLELFFFYNIHYCTLIIY